MRWIRVMLAVVLAAAAAEAKDRGTSTGSAATDSVMVALQAKSRAISTCTARVVTRIELEGERIEYEGAGSFQLPGRMRIERTLPDGSKQVVVSDGSTLWIHDVAERTVSRINLGRVLKATGREADLDTFDPLRPFRGVAWSSIRYAGRDSLDGAGLETFEAQPLQSLLTLELPVELAATRLWVHPDDGLLRLVELLDEAGRPVLSQRFRDVKADAEPGPRAFQFVVPAGAYPIDATDAVIEALGSLDDPE